MLNLKQLKEFLLKANMPHATGTSKMVKEQNGSRTIKFSDGDWSMEDNFFGGEPYGGRQVVFYKQAPAWICVYYGQVHSTNLTPDKVYDFLRKALQYPPADRPFRGPDSYKQSNLEYQNSLDGDADGYAGKEVILEDGKEIYWAKYLGGLVDQRARESF